MSPITPVPGDIGPTTGAVLLARTVEAADRQVARFRPGIGVGSADGWIMGGASRVPRGGG
ncbi:hypothetical protein ACFVGM_10050 [Kitasatospora purpeofusca]|uniref:hypothetical protein n=1 Tax=Kitasatospora purpeofusca TaxID=67352 RepID=UPI0036BF4CCF